MGSLSQIVSLAGNPGVTTSSLDSGALLAYVSFWEQGLGQSQPSDDAFVNLIFLGATSNNISGWATPEIDSHSGAWSNYSAYVPIPASTRFIQYSMNFVRYAGNDLDGFIDDNVLAVTDAVQRPVLNIAGSSTNVTVSWPVIYSDGFQLQQNTNLTVTNWNFAVGAFTNVFGTNRASLPLSVKNQFFRLYHP